MQIIAQSQPPTQTGYIHLAYISAQLSNPISKGDLLPTQAVLGAALAAAMAGGVIGAKLKRNGPLGRAVTIGSVIGLIAMLILLKIIEFIWAESRSNEQVVNRVIKTQQWWALREEPIAAGVEAAMTTNDSAAILAAKYYSFTAKGWTGKNPELVVKICRFSEEATAKGIGGYWIINLTNEWNTRDFETTFESALKRGKLSPAEETWARQKLAEMAKLN